jgi:hypothetical protein
MTIRKGRPTLAANARASSIRSGRAKSAETPGGKSTIDEDVSRAVKSGYGVITDALQQGRKAAERFRKGEYTIAASSDDIGKASRRMLELAGALSQTTFYLCERLLTELAGAAAQEPPGQMKLTVTVEGDKTGKASGRSGAIDRPEHGDLKDISATPLASPTGGVLRAKVTFGANLATGGLTAVVKLSSSTRPGVYQGLVLAREQPLGSLAVEISE